MAIFGEFRCGDIHSDTNVAFEFVTGALDGFTDKFEWFVVATFDTWSKTTFIANGCSVAFVFEDGGEIMEDFGAHTNSVLHVGRTSRDDHIFLEIGGPASVCTTVHDVHHWHWEAHVVVGASEVGDVFVETATFGVGNGFCGSERRQEWR